MTLSDLYVLTADDAQNAIVIADAAIEGIKNLRANVGAIENQFSSSASNLTVGKLNITSVESAIKDIDFAEETANFAKMQVLVNAGVFAVPQGNQISSNLLSLLQVGKS